MSVYYAYVCTSGRSTYIHKYESIQYVHVYVHMPNSNSKSKPVEPVANSICIWALELRYIFYLSAEPACKCHVRIFAFWQCFRHTAHVQKQIQLLIYQIHRHHVWNSILCTSRGFLLAAQMLSFPRIMIINNWQGLPN